MSAPSQIESQPTDVVEVMADPTVIEPLVARMCSQYDVGADHVRRLATEILRQFAGARLRSFVPVLVEKQLRDRLRRLQLTGVDSS